MRVVSVTATGNEPIGVIVTVRFAGNVEQALGRGHLKRAVVAMILQPKSATFKIAGLATAGAGAIGHTLRGTRSKNAGVVRSGRTIAFFVAGPGLSNVGKILVKAFVTAPPATRRVLQATRDSTAPVFQELAAKVAYDTALIPAPSPDSKCSELETMKKEITGGLLLRADLRAQELQRLRTGIELQLDDVTRLRDKLIPKDVVDRLINTIFDVAVKLEGGDETTANQLKTYNDLLPKLRESLRLTDEYIKLNKEILGKLHYLLGRIEALIEVRCVQPKLTEIQAVFTKSTFSTVYTEKATGHDLKYQWAVSIPADPLCAGGFQPGTPQPNEATWYHADQNEGGSCNHNNGTAYDAAGRGHPGIVVVQVSNDDFTCIATYHGTQGDGGAPEGVGDAPRLPCTAK